MFYKIGDIAELLGISIEAIRYYEKLGLVTPVRDEQSGYRLFRPVDLNMLMRVRRYNGIGYTVSESADLIDHADLHDLALSMEAKREDVREQIYHQMRVHNCIMQRQAHLLRVSGMVGECAIEYSPAMYAIFYRSDLELTEDSESRRRVREWLEMRPFTEAFLSHPLSFWQGEEFTYLQGLCLSADYAKYYDIREDSHVRYYPSRKSVYILVCVPYEGNDSYQEQFEHLYDHVKDFLRDRGLTATGDAYGRTLHTSRKSGEYIHYCEQWIPID